jgi:hypothetical protein
MRTMDCASLQSVIAHAGITGGLIAARILQQTRHFCAVQFGAVAPGPRQMCRLAQLRGWRLVPQMQNLRLAIATA